jgi:hypothetical protein
MQTWTLLFITALGGPFDGERTGTLIYASMDACLAAHQTVSAGLGYDHKIACQPTTAVSSSIRPKRRPENLK